VTAVVVGASAGLGRALAAQLAASGRPLLLVASDQRDLDAVASDLALSHGVTVDVLAADATDPMHFGRELERAAAAHAVEEVILPIGATSAEDDCLTALPVARHLMNVNFLSVVAAVGALAPRLAEQGHGSIVGFGSIAATRGRARNAMYAASKRALASYFESLRHQLEPSGVAVSFYVLGYLDTQQAYGQELRLPKAKPEVIAAEVCRRLGRAGASRHRPRFWLLLTLLLRALPWRVYRKLRF
jgi:short-subunit dehydrogenase